MMKFLFVKRRFAWPRASGHDVHTYQMMLHLQKQGHPISLLSLEPSDDKALEGLELYWSECSQEPSQTMQLPSDPPLTYWQRRFVSFWGINPNWIPATQAAVESSGAEVVVVSGRELLPLLAGITGRKRVWYAADDAVLHHLSLLIPSKPSTWGNLKMAAIGALYERTHSKLTDRVWVVSPRDAAFGKFWMPSASFDCVPNGVDAQFFSPRAVSKKPKSCVFWGRLDFPPNIDAVRWFSEQVWREIHRRHPDASFHVYGFAPTDEVRQMAQQFQFDLVADSPDIRDAVSSCEVVVLPFISGAGIKNKLLEASGMQLPIIASPMAMNGIDDSQLSPCLVAKKPSHWIDHLERLWSDPKLRQSLGATARQWCLEFASWDTTAKKAAAALQATPSTAKQ
jgi:glycosyltransferase involved in cell wall biosynthesis